MPTGNKGSTYDNGVNQKAIWKRLMALSLKNQVNNDVDNITFYKKRIVKEW